MTSYQINEGSLLQGGRQGKQSKEDHVNIEEPKFYTLRESLEGCESLHPCLELPHEKSTCFCRRDALFPLPSFAGNSPNATLSETDSAAVLLTPS